MGAFYAENIAAHAVPYRFMMRDFLYSGYGACL
jgi:hypothetical protein